MSTKSEGRYQRWTRQDLIDRLTVAESELAQREVDLDAVLRSRENEAGAEATAAAAQVKEGNDSNEGKKNAKKGPRVEIDPSRYSTRSIGLRIAYLGKNYGGFEFQSQTDLPTIEEELWKALTMARLIYPKDKREVDFACCDYSKCGRTDKGVSAFGQVVSLRVRSNRPLPKVKEPPSPPVGTVAAVGGDGATSSAAAVPGGEEKMTETAEVGGYEELIKAQQEEESRPFDDIKDEIQYATTLNRLLPRDIRVLAWCPSPTETFSARFSCRERRYRYFFTQPAYPPVPEKYLEGRRSNTGKGKQRGSGGDCNGWLDIDKMRDAAKLFEGSHDFRNFCKIDPAKQINNYVRKIFHTGISEVEGAATGFAHLALLESSSSSLPNDKDGGTSQPQPAPPPQALPRVYSFDVHATAFLWHQIRCMVSILFLVGQGLEEPSLISDMLDVQKMQNRTAYLLAHEVPLVLWDCIFPSADDTSDTRSDSLRWVYPTEECEGASRTGALAVGDAAWTNWRHSKIDEILAGQLLQLIEERDPPGERVRGGGGLPSDGGAEAEKQRKKTKPRIRPLALRVFEGGNNSRRTGVYEPVATLKPIKSVQEQNDAYARKLGHANSEEMRKAKAEAWLAKQREKEAAKTGEVS